MKFIIIGSGGCVCIPKPLCGCAVCTEARAKGRPYWRCGCSLYLEDAALLVDTPEDISAALNAADIKAVDTVCYSHWDPDHTLGMRVMEQLRLEWLDYYDGLRPRSPVEVLCHPAVMKDVNAISSKYGSFMDYYEHMGLIVRRETKGPFTRGGVKITLVQTPKKKAVSVFVFEDTAGGKLIYAPCDCVPFPDEPILYGADMLILGNTFVGDRLKGGKEIGANHPLRGELHSLEGAIKIKERLGAGELIVTHIEEDWGKSYGDYLALERTLEGVKFAYDGLVVRC